MTTETQSKTSNAKISEALDLLNEAAREKKVLPGSSWVIDGRRFW